jgi:hypothetical protein
MGLEQVHDRLVFNMDAINQKEREDAQEEAERAAEVEAERKKQARLQKILDRNAKRLAGEQVSETEGENDSEEEVEAVEKVANENAGEEVLSSDEELNAAQAALRAKEKTSAGLDDAAGLPIPSARQGSFRELPPLQAGAGFGWKGPVAEVNRTVTPPSQAPRHDPPPPLSRMATPTQRVRTPPQ